MGLIYEGVPHFWKSKRRKRRRLQGLVYMALYTEGVGLIYGGVGLIYGGVGLI